MYKNLLDHIYCKWLYLQQFVYSSDVVNKILTTHQKNIEAGGMEKLIETELLVYT